LVGGDLDLPDDVYGFGSWLLWVLATRATAVVDQAFAVGPARPSRHYGMVDGHPVPTPSLVAWLLTAAEAGLPVDGLSQRDRRLDERQKVLRTVVSRAIGGEPRLFKDGWLGELAAVCGLGQAELDLLYRCRGEDLTGQVAHRLQHPGVPRPPAGDRRIARTRMGYDGTELRLTDGELIDPSMPTADRARVKRTVTEAGPPVVAVDSSVRLTGDDPRRR
jgi:hypothetical protein